MIDSTNHFAPVEHMSDNSDLLPAGQDELFETQMRGYNRHQVEEFAERHRRQAASLAERLSAALGEADRLRTDLEAARQTAASRPPREELTERMAQILTLAGEEASAQKTRVAREITQLRGEAQGKANTLGAEATSQAERMLASAHERAGRVVAGAKAEADQTVRTGRAEAEQAVARARAQAQATVDQAAHQARQLLEEAAARASAIHDGAEKRFAQLKDRHAVAMARLTDIRDVVTGLVGADTARGSPAAEVAGDAAATLAAPVDTDPAARATRRRP